VGVPAGILPTAVPVPHSANKKPPGRRHRRLRANAMWRSPSG